MKYYINHSKMFLMQNVSYISIPICGVFVHFLRFFSLSFDSTPLSTFSIQNIHPVSININKQRLIIYYKLFSNVTM